MISSLERWFFKLGLLHPRIFRTLLRPIAYAKANQDPEAVHTLAMEMLNKHQSVLDDVSKHFKSSILRVHLKEREVIPFGSAAGLDKNGTSLLPMSKLFGFLEPGTVVLDPRAGNDLPRVYVDNDADNIYNAQGFPSDGFGVFESNLRNYRDHGGVTPVYVSICGLPEDQHKLDIAHQQLESMVRSLRSMADGFVWNPFSPNTDALRALRTPENFRLSAELIHGNGIESHLRLVKMGPFDEGDESDWLKLVEAWLEGGGDGVVAVNTYLTPKSNLPVLKWGYQSAGLSGRSLAPYRDRAIVTLRKHFPEAIIIATGGIDDSDHAWRCFELGANALEGYTPFTFWGFGILRQFIRDLERRVEQEQVRTLQEFIESR